MAKIDVMPSMSVIRSYRGVLDFAVYKGQPYVRRWPRNKHSGSTPGARINQPAFTYAQAILGLVGQQNRDAMTATVEGSPQLWRDQVVQGYFGTTQTTIDLPFPGE